MLLLLACADHDTLLREAGAALQVEDHATVVEKLDAALAMEPDDDRSRQVRLLSLHALGREADALEGCRGTGELSGRARIVCGRLALDAHPAEALGWLEDAVLADPGNRKLRVDLERARAALPHETPPAEAPNVVLVVLDTLRADHLGSYGHEAARTPVLDRLASEGVRFADAMSQAPWTAASVATLFTGLTPSVHGIDGGVKWGAEDTSGDLPFLVQKSLSPRHVTLAQRLQEQGWTTAGFVSNAYVNTVFGFSQGFEVYGDEHDDYSQDIAGAKRRGEETNRRVRAWLDEGPEEPFFLFVHYNDPHWPYDPLPPFDQGFEWYTGELTPEKTTMVVEHGGKGIEGLSEQDMDYLRALYDAEIAYLDREVGVLLANVEAASSRDTLVVVTADHGEEFGDHGNTSHGYTLYQEQVHVPLLVHGLEHRGVVVEDLVRTMDVAPTVLDAVGLPPELGEGQSLLPMLEGGAGPTEGFAEATYGRPEQAIRRGSTKQIESPDTVERYDLAEDPRELRDLGGDAALSEALATWREQAAATKAALGAGDTEVQLDEATRARLEALGYLD